MKTSMAIQILPNMGSDGETVRVVDEVIACIRESGLNYYVGPFETAVEGDDLHELTRLMEACIRTAAEAGSEKVSAYVKLVYKPEGSILTIHEKVAKHHE